MQLRIWKDSHWCKESTLPSSWVHFIAVHMFHWTCTPVWLIAWFETFRFNGSNTIYDQCHKYAYYFEFLMENLKYLFFNFEFSNFFQNPKPTCLFPGFGFQMVSHFSPYCISAHYTILNWIMYYKPCRLHSQLKLICQFALYHYLFMLCYYNSHVWLDACKHNKVETNLIKYLCCRK